MIIYDAYGRPVDMSVLNKELAAPTLSGIRTLWQDSVTGGLTPSRLANILRSAAEGDITAYLTLAEEIEERDTHFFGVLGTRKRAVKRLPIVVESASDSKDDIKLADAVRMLVRRPGFKDMIEELMDGVNKGFSVVEMNWDKSGKTWLPDYVWRDPRFFTFDRVNRQEIRLLDDTNTFDGLPLPPYKFITHFPKLKTGIPVRGGLARIVAWSYLFKNYSVKDWMAFAEVFGMPLRVGKYGSGATPTEKDILRMAVANLGTDAAAVIPESMKIEFVEQKVSGGSQLLFERMADWFDRQVEFCVLGQTGTTQGTPGKLGNEDSQDRVRDDIRDSDAEQIESTINRDVVRAFIDLNFGPQENYPAIKLQILKREDVTTMSAALKDLVPLGLKVESSVVRDKLGFPDPAEGAECLGSPTSQTPNGLPEPAKAKNRQKALNAEGIVARTAVDDIIGMAQKNTNLDAMIAPLEDLLNQCASLEEFKDRLLDVYDKMDTETFGLLMQQAMTLAELCGRFEAKR